MTQTWVASLKEKTGRSLDEWLALVAKKGPKEEAARGAWLKTEHGLATNSAWWLAERSLRKGLEASDPDFYLKATERAHLSTVAGKRAVPVAVFDALLKL